MLWGKPDGYSFSPGVDETPFNDGSEAAGPEAISVLDEPPEPTARYGDLLICFWLCRGIPTVEKHHGVPPVQTPGNIIALFFRSFIRHVVVDLADNNLKRLQERKKE